MEEPEKNVESLHKSSLGMDENVAGLLTYVFGFITGIIFFVMEKESRFVKFHAMQSILLSVVFIVLSSVLGLIPILGWLMLLLLSPVGLILWILMMYKAYKHEWFKLPVIGDISDKQAKF